MKVKEIVRKIRNIKSYDISCDGEPLYLGDRKGLKLSDFNDYEVGEIEFAKNTLILELDKEHNNDNN